MQAPSQTIATEAKQLNVRIEKEGDEWIAVLPAHPDLQDDEELGLPAQTEQAALDEARAYRAIEQSSVYKFDYEEKKDVYTVSFGERTFEGKLLAPTYAEAQQAYAEHINKPEPPAAEPAPSPEKKTRQRRSNGNGRKSSTPSNRESITSGVGDAPGQLPHPNSPVGQMMAEDAKNDPFKGEPPLRTLTPATHPIDPRFKRLHDSAFEYLKPDGPQREQMQELRKAAKAYSDVLEQILPDGPDKTHALRLHRTTAMWANVAITREPDGAPRS